MAVSFKTLIILGVLAACISQNEARKLQKRALNDTSTKRHGGYGFKESNEYGGGRPNQYNCQGYYDCMGQMEGKVKELSSLRSEQNTLLATMTSVNKKALEQERMLNKLVPQAKRMRREMEDLQKKYEEAEKELIAKINEIAEGEERRAMLQRIIDEILSMCKRITADISLTTGEYGYYYIYDGTSDFTWWEAQNFCRRNGMNLVSIETNAEDEDIHDMIIDTYQPPGAPGTTPFYWIGLNNFETTTDEFSWVGTGHGTSSGTSSNTFEYENWENGSPSINIATQNCVAMYSTDGNDIYWYDQTCSLSSKFICELPPICYHLQEVETRMLGGKKTNKK